MSRGLGKVQRTILAILRGEQPTRCYALGCGEFVTSELLEELIEADVLDGGRPQKHLMATVVRACRGLVDRDLLAGVRTFDAKYPWANTITWRLPANPPADAARSSG